MQFQTIEPPRTFHPAGPQGPEISHVATVELRPNEQVTIVTEGGAANEIPV